MAEKSKRNLSMDHEVEQLIDQDGLAAGRLIRLMETIEEEVRDFIRQQYPDSRWDRDLHSSQVRGLIRSAARRFADLESRIEDLEKRKET